jgi:putative endonuclease
LQPPPLNIEKLYNNPITYGIGQPDMDSPQYCVYILTDAQHTRFYTGRTGDLHRRVVQHRSGNGGVFTRRYNLVKLVYYEQVEDETEARLREKQIKKAGKKKRLSLIMQMNPGWEDLFDKL